jgi:hypothetical protein
MWLSHLVSFTLLCTVTKVDPVQSIGHYFVFQILLHSLCNSSIPNSPDADIISAIKLPDPGAFLFPKFLWRFVFHLLNVWFFDVITLIDFQYFFFDILFVI